MEITSLSYFAFPQSRRRCFLIYLLTIQWQAAEINVIFNEMLFEQSVTSFTNNEWVPTRISLDWSSFGKRVVSIKKNPSVKTTWIKTINKCSHLKVVSPHLLSKSKRKPAKEVYLSKTAAGKVTAWNFNKKIPSQVPFTITFFRIFQHTKVVVVNVKHKFHLESR